MCLLCLTTTLLLFAVRYFCFIWMFAWMFDDVCNLFVWAVSIPVIKVVGWSDMIHVEIYFSDWWHQKGICPNLLHCFRNISPCTAKPLNWEYTSYVNGETVIFCRYFEVITAVDRVHLYFLV